MTSLAMQPLAPIVLFAFARPEHTQRTLDALAGNSLAIHSQLIVYADAARHQGDEDAVRAVRNLVRHASGFQRVTLIERSSNFGLAQNIIQGVTETLHQYESIIVLEDDMVTSPFFLTYMNDALERYKQEERVVSIHGYVYPLGVKMPEAFFLPGADCWGWATWRRGWACFNPDGTQLLSEIKKRNLAHAFDFQGTYQYTRMLEEQIAGTNNSWAIRWYASAFLLDKLTLYPGRSMVQNIGNDASGTHCERSSSMDAILSDRPICLNGVDVKASSAMQLEFAHFFNRQARPAITKWIQLLLDSFTRKWSA